jgi:hypothetical protein
MEQHHQDTIDRFVNRYRQDENVLAILIGGSIAHGFAKPDSDVDALIIVSEPEHARRKQLNKLAFSIRDPEICTYEGGYVDCKVATLPFLETIAEQGSDAARYAFKDAKVVFSRVGDLSELLARVTRFNDAEQASRRHRFVCQLLAWKWYFSEAVKKDSDYLRHLATQKVMLFSCRLVLNENRMLYPYHKWLLNETQRASLKPRTFDESLSRIGNAPTLDLVNAFVAEVLEFVKLGEKDVDWPNQFLADSEFNWLYHQTPVDDL